MCCCKNVLKLQNHFNFNNLTSYYIIFITFQTGPRQLFANEIIYINLHQGFDILKYEYNTTITVLSVM